MDLIYANEKAEDINVIHDYTFDLAFGKDENNFELTLDRNNHCCKEGYFIYIEGTEYGGVIDSIQVITDTEKVIYKGRTWHGILSKKILCPDNSQDYLTVNGEANSIISSLLERIGLSDMFEADTTDSQINISYQFARFIDAYTGFRKMLVANGCKLIFKYKMGRVVLSTLPFVDYSKDEQFDSDQIALDIQKNYNKINHLICLGAGELKDRQVIHLYADASGNISKTQTFTGIDEQTAIYDYPNAESLEVLEQGGIERLKECIVEGAVAVDFDAEETVYDIDDVVGSRENVTGIEVTASITKKIVTIEKGTIKIKYEVGE
jgi:hypothetical protein